MAQLEHTTLAAPAGAYLAQGAVGDLVGVRWQLGLVIGVLVVELDELLVEDRHAAVRVHLPCVWTYRDHSLEKY